MTSAAPGETEHGLANAYVLDGRGGGAPLDWAGVERWRPLQRADWAFWALCGAFVAGVTAQLWFCRRRGWFGG